MPSVRRKLGMNLVWNTLNTWGATGLTLLATIVYARLLGAEAWGIYSTFTWLVTTGSVLVILGWNLTINKFVAEAAGQGRMKRAAAIFQTLLALELGGALVLAAISAVFLPQLAATLGRPEVIAAAPLILLGVIAMVLFTTCNMGLIALQRYRPMSITVLASSGLGLGAGVLWLRGGGGPEGLLAVTAGANLANAAVSLYFLSRALPLGSRFTFDRALVPPIARYALSAAFVLVLMQIVYERAEVFFLSRSQPAEQVGFYSLAVAMTNIAINGLPNIVIGPLLAMAAELHSRGDRAGLRQLFDAATGLLILIAPAVGVGAALAAWPLIRWLYGEVYGPVAVAAMLMLPPAALLMVAKPANSLIWGLGRQDLVLKALLPGAALNLALDALVIPTFGLYGAVLASAFAQAVTTLVGSYLCLRYLGFPFPWSRFRRALAAALLMVPFVAPVLFVLDGPAALVAQALLGATVYALALARLGLLDGEGAALLARLQRHLPPPLHLPLAALVAFGIRAS